MRVNLDAVDIESVDIHERADGSVGVTFFDFRPQHGTMVTLWTQSGGGPTESARRMQTLLLRALQRLEAFTSAGASGLPRNKP